MSRCGAVLSSVLWLLLCAGATDTNSAISIIQRNLTVREGDQAVFMCEVPCTHNAFWYIGDFHNSFALPYEDSLPELAYSRAYSSCNSAGRYNDTLTLLATLELNNVAIQCSASMIDCSAGDASCSTLIYSRFRVLRVEGSDPTSSTSPPPSPSSPPVQESTPCPSSPPVQESIPCPSPTPVVVTSVETIVSTSVSTETVTTTQRVTHTATPSPTSCAASPGSSDAQRSPSLLSRLRLSGTSLLLCLSVLHAVL